MAMQHWAVNTLPVTELLYSRCTELYRSMAIRLPQALYTFWEVPQRLVHKVYDTE